MPNFAAVPTCFITTARRARVAPSLGCHPSNTARGMVEEMGAGAGAA